MKKVFGLTGGIGSGKSSVAAWIKNNCGWRYIDADAVVRSLLEPKAAGWRSLKNILGQEFFDSQGALKRELLRSVIFKDKDLRRGVEQAVHPLVLEKIKAEIDGCRAGDKKMLVEVPLLYEAGWQKYFDAVIVVYAEPELCLQRVKERDGVSGSEASVAIAAQIPLKEKIEMADYVIDNSGSWPETIMKLDRLLTSLS